MSGFVVWFTGLSGAGKSTLAAMLSAELRRRGVHVEVLDGDEVRTHLSKGLGFSREDRDTNVRRIGYVAKLIARSGGCAMTAAISPYRAIRAEQRAQNPRFVEVYCRCSIPALAARDPKGLYQKALAGEIKNFTGVDDPYEEPENPEVVVDTAAESKEESLARIVARLEEMGHVPGVGGGKAAGAAKSRLIAPHGGELVSRVVSGAEREALVELAGSLPAIGLDERGERDLEMIATGAFSPLKGFMGSKDYLRVVREMRLENGIPWPVPITLAVSAEAAARLAPGARAALRARDGRVVAVLDVTDVWLPDKGLEAREVHGSSGVGHPAVAHLVSSGTHYVGGEVHALSLPGDAAFPSLRRDPRATRALLAERGWARVVAFVARGAMLRADEYVTKAALEIVDGLLIHAAVGDAESGAESAEVRIRCLEALIEGYYRRERVLLSIDPAAARGGGPRAGLFHALVRQNYGASHFIVARERAEHGSGVNDARRAFAAFAPGEIGIEPLFFEDAFYSARAGGMGTVKTAPDEADAAAPAAELVRPEVAAILSETRQRGA